jgi:tripeptide aminopeptidase
VIDRYPQTVDYAIEAIRRAGLTPVRSSIRGGTDGSRLEWVSRQDMEKAAEMIVHLAMIWEERA